MPLACWICAIAAGSPAAGAAAHAHALLRVVGESPVHTPLKALTLSLWPTAGGFGPSISGMWRHLLAVVMHMCG